MNTIVRKFPTTDHDIHVHSILASVFSHPDEAVANEILSAAKNGAPVGRLNDFTPQF
jgi:hypothetical protein